MRRFVYRNKDIILVSLILLALLLVVFKEVIFLDYVFIKRDISRYYYPLRKFAASLLRQGELPLWNPYLFCGTPLHAPIQNSVFYPLSLIYYLMDVARGFSLFIIAHIFLSGLFMYLFMRNFKISKEAAFLSGLAFTFSGYIMSAINLTIALNAVTWFPLAMLIFLKGLKARTYRTSLWLGFILTLLFLAGDPSVAISTWAIIFLTSAYLFVERLIKNKQADSFIMYNLIIALAAFFLLSAFQILPALEYYIRTARVDMGWPEASAWSMPFSDFFSLIIPYFNDLTCYYRDYWGRQAWLDNYYVGVTTLFLAGFALVLFRRSRLIQFLCLIGLMTLAMCLGKNFVLYPLLYKLIPLVRLMRYPVRFFYIFTFSICALAGIGYHHLKEVLVKGDPRRLSRSFLLIGFLSVIPVIILTFFAEPLATPIIERVIAAHQGNPFFNPDRLSSLIYADIFNLRRSFLYIACFGLFIFLGGRTRNKGLITVSLFLLVGFDLIFTNTGYEPVEKRSRFKEPTENMRYLMEDNSLFRIMASPYTTDRFTYFREASYYEGMRNAKDRFVTNRMMEFGLYDMWGYGSTVLRRNLRIAQQLHSQKKPTDTKLLDLLNVKYVSSHEKMRAPGYRKANQTSSATVYLNSRYLPRALLLRKTLIMDKDEDILEYIFSKRFNPKKEIVLEEEIELPEKDPGKGSRLRKDKIDIVKYTPQVVEISVAAKEPAFLLLSDTYYPGWKAYIDGRPGKIYRADYFLRAVKIPEGEHSVTFVYDPLSFKIGAGISIISLLALLLYLGNRHCEPLTSKMSRAKQSQI